MDDLLNLAERCEKATGPDRALDASIYFHLNPTHRSISAKPYTASLDAALTLVPEGWCYRIEINGASVGESHPLEGRFCHAATPALALTAAALRALAGEQP